MDKCSKKTLNIFENIALNNILGDVENQFVCIQAYR
jgi:hypothetical protein